MNKAIACLIEAMGMFVHDLQEVQKTAGMPYAEECYQTLAASVHELQTSSEKESERLLVMLANEALNQFMYTHGTKECGTERCMNFIQHYLKLVVPSDKGFEIVLSFDNGVCCVTECSERVAYEDSDPDTPRDIETIAFRVAENALREIAGLNHTPFKTKAFIFGYVNKAVFDATGLYVSVFDVSYSSVPHEKPMISKFELCSAEVFRG